MSDDGSCRVVTGRQLKKGHHSVAMTKKSRQFFRRKNKGDIDSVGCRPGWHQP